MLALTPNGPAEWTITAGAVVGALAVIWTKLLRPAWRGLVRFVHGMQLLIDGVEFVRNQMTNNGGSTLKDAIDRTEARADEIAERLEQIDTRVEFLETVYRKQDEVDRAVADNARKLAELRPTLHLPPKET